MGTIIGQDQYRLSYTADVIDQALGMALVSGSALQADLSLYVSTAGDDTSGDGSQANPYATPQKALDSVPKNLNGFTASIYIESGTYSSTLSLIGFHGGKLQIGDIGGTETVIVENIYVVSCSDVVLYVDTVTGGVTATGKLYLESSNIFIAKSISIGGGGTDIGVYANFGSTLVTGYAVVLTCSSCSIAVLAMPGSRCNFNDVIAGNGNGTGLQSVGAVITFGTNNMAATTLYSRSVGGQILTGAGVNP